jgi:hypothetical protein
VLLGARGIETRGRRLEEIHVEELEAKAARRTR